jgi:carbon-monoxide dehydrogenase large subunit
LAEIGAAGCLHPERLPPGEDPGLEVTTVYQPALGSGTFSYATHAALVALDPDLGTVKLLDYVVVHDCGTIVNPMVVEGQVVGGVAQGIGTALYEEIPHDENGQPLASTFMDYLMPGATEVPDIRVLNMNSPSPHTAYGIKGLGEGGAIAPPAAIANAVNDALRPLRARVDETPLNPARVRAAIATAAGASKLDPSELER